MPTELHSVQEEPGPVDKDQPTGATPSGNRTIAKRFRETGELVVVVLRIGTAAVALYVAIKGIGPVS